MNHQFATTPRPRTRPARCLHLTAGLGLITVGLLVAGCSTANPGATDASGDPATPTTLTVITHDSFDLTDEAKERFATQTGLTVTYIAPGDVGTIVNQLILTKDAPLGDVVFGIDNTFAGRAIGAGVLAPYASPELPSAAAPWAADDSEALTPIDYGDVCLNADDTWFAEHGLPLPRSLDDLVQPDYANLLVVPNPASSSPGLAFLSATVGSQGDPGYLDYWSALKANGVKITSGWTEAYTVEFSGSSGHGDRPLVLSYASSPMYEEDDQGEARTSALPATCFRQVEYAGVLAGAANPAGAQQFIDFLLSEAVQSEIPETMYMSPINPDAQVPANWALYTDIVTDPINVPAALIAAQRDTWIQAWTETVLG
jgi:thiamine transport system substrate-binding protein